MKIIISLVNAVYVSNLKTAFHVKMIIIFMIIINIVLISTFSS